MRFFVSVSRTPGWALTKWFSSSFLTRVASSDDQASVDLCPFNGVDSDIEVEVEGSEVCGVAFTMATFAFEVPATEAEESPFCWLEREGVFNGGPDFVEGRPFCLLGREEEEEALFEGSGETELSGFTCMLEVRNSKRDDWAASS